MPETTSRPRWKRQTADHASADHAAGETDLGTTGSSLGAILRSPLLTFAVERGAINIPVVRNEPEDAILCRAWAISEKPTLLLLRWVRRRTPAHATTSLLVAARAAIRSASWVQPVSLEKRRKLIRYRDVIEVGKGNMRIALQSH